MRICQYSGVETFLLGLWVSVAATDSGSVMNMTASYRGEVVLPCTVSSQSAKRVYWQRDDSKMKVVAVVYYGNRDKCTVCDPGYAKRTSFIGDMAHGDFSLSLRNISLADEGSYHCVIQLHNTSIQQHFVHLKVTAQYSQPNISVARLGDGHPSNQVKITCSSQGGYPEASVRWVNTMDNSTFPKELVQTETKVDALGLYALNSILRVNMSSDPIACHIITSMAKNSKKSSEVHPQGQGTRMLGNIAATTNPEMPFFLFCLLMSSPLLLLS